MQNFRQLILVAGIAGLGTVPAIAGDLEGRVLGKSGDGVANAFIMLEGTDHTAVTDGRGHFHFDDLDAGPYTVVVTAEGGERAEKAVDVPENGEAHVSLTLAAQLQKVVVRSSAFGDRGTLDLSQPVELISGAELDALKQSSIGETLSNQLGVNSTYGGPATGRPVIRGLSGSRVRVQQDGIASLDVSALSPDHAVPMESLLVDSVEIVKGPATLLYGNGAFGGVINMEDGRIPDEAPLTPYSGALELRADTVADERTGVLRLDGGTHNFTWHADAFRRQTTNVEIPSSAESLAQLQSEGEAAEYSDSSTYLDNSDIIASGGAFGTSIIGENGFIGAAVSNYQSNYGVPGHAHHEEEEEEHAEGVHGEEGVRIDLTQTRYDMKSELTDPFSGFEIVRFRVGMNEYRHAEIEEGAIGTVFNNDELDGRIELVHAPLAGWRGAFGVQVRDREFSAIGDEAYIPPTDATALGFFLVEEREFDKWRVELGVRTESQEQKPTGLAHQDDNTLSLSAGTAWRYADNASLGINLSRAQRAPEIEERFSDGAHLATQQFEIGDPNLREETANNIDLTWKRTGQGLRWTVNLFYNRVDDFIYLQNTGIEQDELPVAIYTQADATLRGYEAEISFPLTEANGSEWRARLFSDFTRGSLVDGGDLPRIPPQRAGASINYSTRQFTFGMDAIYHAEQDRTAEFELPTDSYTMMNADASWDLLGTHLDWTVFLRVNNLLDEEARRHTSFLKDLAPLPGRNVTLGVRAHF
jgi:iron complex outermembrane receptor protein